VGATLLWPCIPTPCKEVVEDWAGTGRAAAIGLESSTGNLALRVELPRAWVTGREDWLILVGGNDPYKAVEVKAWDTAKSVGLRQMPASVNYPAVAKTLGVSLLVKLTPGEAAIALIPGGARCYVKVRAPNGYVLHCGKLFQSLVPQAPAEAMCEGGETENEAIMALDNAKLAGLGDLIFILGMDTPPLNPSNNVFVISLLDAGNLTVDSNVNVPAMQIPQPRLQSQVALAVSGIESREWLQLWGEAALQSGALLSSLAKTLKVVESSISIDALEAKLGVPSTSRRLQAGLSGYLQVDYSVFESDNRSLDELEAAVSESSFATELVQNFGDATAAAGLTDVTLETAAYVLKEGATAQPPNCSTPTLRWSTSEADAAGQVQLNLIFQSPTTLLRAVLVKMPDGYKHRIRTATGMEVTQRGAEQPFPVLGNDEDGSFIETWNQQTFRVLLKAGANVSAGGYAFEVPFKMPMTNPIENMWEISLCTGIYCDGPRHESVVTSFAVLGFQIGDTPNLVAAETTFDASNSAHRSLFLSLLLLVSQGARLWR